MWSLSLPLNQLPPESLRQAAPALPRMSCMITHVQHVEVPAGSPTRICRNKHPGENLDRMDVLPVKASFRKRDLQVLAASAASGFNAELAATVAPEAAHKVNQLHKQ